MASQFVRGVYKSGSNHSVHRPNFYKNLGTVQGTINIQLPPETDEQITIPNERVAGADKFDFDVNQDFLVRRCRLKGVSGYQVLPIDKTTGHFNGLHGGKIIEITLKEKISIRFGETLEVELEGF